MNTRSFSFVFATLLLIGGVTVSATAQQRPDPATQIAAQKDAMKKLAWMDGVWRGPAWTILPSGVKHEITQTERIGPFLDASVKMMEGRGYEPAGTVTFNALGVLSFNPSTNTYSLHSYAQGQAGDFVLTPTADGYIWEIPAGPMIIRYTAVLKDGNWREVGDRIVAGKDPVRFFEMNLKRAGNTDWPLGTPVPLK